MPQYFFIIMIHSSQAGDVPAQQGCLPVSLCSPSSSSIPASYGLCKATWLGAMRCACECLCCCSTHTFLQSLTQIQCLKAQNAFNLWFFTLLRLASHRNQGASQVPCAVFSHLVWLLCSQQLVSQGSLVVRWYWGAQAKKEMLLLDDLLGCPGSSKIPILTAIYPRFTSLPLAEPLTVI